MILLLIGLVLCGVGILANNFIRDDKIGDDATGRVIFVLCELIGVFLSIIGIICMFVS